MARDEMTDRYVAYLDGARVATDELDMYRVVEGLICEVVGTVDNARLAHVS